MTENIKLLISILRPLNIKNKTILHKKKTNDKPNIKQDHPPQKYKQITKNNVTPEDQSTRNPKPLIDPIV